MAEYRQLGKIINAMQYDGTNEEGVIAFLGYDTEVIENLQMLINPKQVTTGDWFYVEDEIVKSISADVFSNYYQLIETPPDL